MRIDEGLNKAFDIVPFEELQTDIAVIDIPKSNVKEALDFDYGIARTNIHSILKRGEKALSDAIAFAARAEDPKAFEAVGNLIKQLSEANLQLMDVHRRKNVIDHPPAQKGTPVTPVPTTENVTNNNAIFVGPTSELAKFLEKQRG
jgi:hypothetical protein